MHRRRLANLASSLVAATVVVATANFVPLPVTYSAASAAPSPPPRRVAVMDCGLGTPKVRPKTLVLACADANAMAVALKWSQWGPNQAVATGTYTWNLCVPYCAASKKWGRAPARVALSDPVHTISGWLFERLAVRITGKVPRGVPRSQSYSEAPRR